MFYWESSVCAVCGVFCNPLPRLRFTAAGGPSVAGGALIGGIHCVSLRGIALRACIMAKRHIYQLIEGVGC